MNAVIIELVTLILSVGSIQMLEDMKRIRNTHSYWTCTRKSVNLNVLRRVRVGLWFFSSNMDIDRVYLIISINILDIFISSQYPNA